MLYYSIQLQRSFQDIIYIQDTPLIWGKSGVLIKPVQTGLRQPPPVCVFSELLDKPSQHTAEKPSFSGDIGLYQAGGRLELGK